MFGCGELIFLWF